MKKLKILLEMTDEGEPEIIIKCHKLTPDIIKLQQMLASYDAGNGSLIYSIQRNLAASSVISFNNTHKEVYVSRAYYKMLKNKMEERRFHKL